MAPVQARCGRIKPQGRERGNGGGKGSGDTTGRKTGTETRIGAGSEARAAAETGIRREEVVERGQGRRQGEERQ